METASKMDPRLRIHLLAQARHFPLVALGNIRLFISSRQGTPTETVSQNSHLALEARYFAQAFHRLFISIYLEVYRFTY